MSILTQHSEKWIVEQDGPLTDGEPCYLWQRAKTKGGYPKVRRKNDQMDGTCDVHRLVCEEVNGPAPPGNWHASHKCGTRACVNPKHLIWEVPTDNYKRINRDPDQELDHNGRLVPIYSTSIPF